MRVDALERFLERKSLRICWAVIGERRELGPDVTPETFSQAHLWGAYVLDGDKLRGFLKGSTEYHHDPGEPRDHAFDIRDT